MPRNSPERKAVEYEIDNRRDTVEFLLPSLLAGVALVDLVALWVRMPFFYYLALACTAIWVVLKLFVSWPDRRWSPLHRPSTRVIRTIEVLALFFALIVVGALLFLPTNTLIFTLFVLQSAIVCAWQMDKYLNKGK